MAQPIIDQRAARWAARATIPGGRCDRDRVAALRRDVHADLPAIDRAARSWTELGDDLPPTELRVLGRLGWVHSNLSALQGAFEPLSERLSGSRVVASRALGIQLGALFGLLSRRVLGQYILPLGGPGGGQLVVVGPNLLDLAERHGALAADIRRSVLLHEVVHRLQFDAVPWLGDHLRDLLDRYLQGARVDAAAVADLVGRLPEAVGRALETGEITPLVEVVLTEEQSAVIEEAQGLMSLLEGHGNSAMFDAAPAVVEDTEGVRAALNQRRSDVTSRLLAAVAGLEMKHRQYRQGEVFVRSVLDAGGTAALNRAFEGPERLPGRDEITAPDRWLERVGGDDA